MIGRGTTRFAAVGCSAACLLPTGTADAANNPVPNVKIVAAEVSGATGSSFHLNVAITASCAADRADTAGLIVTTAAPRATTDDLVECTNDVVTQIVAVTSAKGRYTTGTPVTITAAMRGTDKKVLATVTRTVTVQ